MWCPLLVITSLTQRWTSWISTKGTWVPRKPLELPLLNQKDDEPELARQEYQFFRIFLARIMDDQVGELLLWTFTWRMFGPLVYLFKRRFTQCLLVYWTMSHTSFPREASVGFSIFLNAQSTKVFRASDLLLIY